MYVEHQNQLRKWHYVPCSINASFHYSSNCRPGATKSIDTVNTCIEEAEVYPAVCQLGLRQLIDFIGIALFYP
jgi:hypothetical protein